MHKKQRRHDAGVYAVDRFISSRVGLDLRADVYRYLLARDAENVHVPAGSEGGPGISVHGGDFVAQLAGATIGQSGIDGARFRVLHHGGRKAPVPSPLGDDSTRSSAVAARASLPSSSSRGGGAVAAARSAQHGLPPSRYHERILDAPELINDFYANLIAWSANDELAVALGNTVHVWDGVTGCNGASIESTASTVTAVEWMRLGAPRIAVGTDGPGTVRMCDLVRGTNVDFAQQLGDDRGSRVMSLSASRVSPSVLASGSNDGAIVLHDTRSPTAVVTMNAAHASQVCGLRFSHDGISLASGGGGGVVKIWDVRRMSGRAAAAATGDADGSVRRFADARGLVKALDWCPWSSHLLATGAGYTDRRVRVYNTATGEMVRDINTDSQVTGVAWSTSLRALVTAGGFGDARIHVRDRVTLESTFKFKRRPERLLGLACTDDGTVACSVDAGELVIFWRLSSRGSRVKVPFPDSGRTPASATDPRCKRVSALSSMRAGLAGTLCIR